MRFVRLLEQMGRNSYLHYSFGDVKLYIYLRWTASSADPCVLDMQVAPAVQHLHELTATFVYTHTNAGTASPLHRSPNAL